MTSRLLFVIALAACRSDADLATMLPPDAVAPADAHGDAAVGRDAATDPDDGAPMRRACTNTFGSALSPQYGRMDGFLVSIVNPGTGGCRADSDHLHLQILVSGAVYDVAVNVGGDVLSTTRDEPIDSSAWSEGWHPFDGIDYQTIGLSSADVTSVADVQTIDAELGTTNHISIYATGYDDTGAHLVHRNNGQDGAIVTHVMSAIPHVRVFRFTDQSF
ncbi:MAG TPA: hypothetical protein VGO00_21715 [Kofleriaceae bacterium]|jgi:hypothetical protein|nr:hypothetical protein [Kofleriaceae bacterium]